MTPQAELQQIKKELLTYGNMKTEEKYPDARFTELTKRKKELEKIISTVIRYSEAGC